MIYLQLFLSFFQIGLFSFGGGYAAMPLIQNQIVNIHHWIDMNAFSDIITISQMTPGPIAVNSATFVGIQLTDIWGGIVATLGCIFPSTVIAILLARVYYKYRSLSVMKGVMNGLRPAVVAMIASAGLEILMLSLFRGEGFSLSVENVDFIAAGIFLLSLTVLRKFKVNQIIVMTAAGIIGGIVYMLV